MMPASADLRSAYERDGFVAIEDWSAPTKSPR